MLWSIDSCQNRVPLTSITWPYRGSGVDPSRSSIFWSYPLSHYQFEMIAGSSLFFPVIHTKYVVFMSPWPRTIKISILNWPRTRKLSQFFPNTGREDLFLRWSHVGDAVRSIFKLWMVKIWQVSSCGTLLAESLAESLRSFLDKSGERLCRHLLNRLICRSSSFLDESDKFYTG